MISSLHGLLLALAVSAAPHEWPDGHVERWCQAVIREEGVHLEYALGFNAETESAVLRALQAEPSDAAATGREAADRGTRSPAMGDLLREHLPRAVTVTIEGVAVAPTAIAAQRSARHPMCWLVRLEYALPGDRSDVSLAIVDGVLPDLGGAARYALRSKTGLWKLAACDAAPLIVRATAIEVPAGATSPRQISAHLNRQSDAGGSQGPGDPP